MEIAPVAIFRSQLGEKFGIPRQAGLTPALTGRIELCGEFKSPDALRGMEGFDYLWLIWGFNLNEGTAGRNRSADCGTNPGTAPDVIGPDAVPDADMRRRLTVRPPRLGGNVRVGVFASRSPFRPNGMGLSSVHIERIDAAAGVITVSGADLADGTPIYDIKPYLSYTDSHPDARGGYTDEVIWNKLEVVIPDDVRRKLSMPAPGCGSSALPNVTADAPCDSRTSPNGYRRGLASDDIEALMQLLSLDPRPHYQDDPDRIYGLSFAGRNIRFRVRDGILTVLEMPVN